MEEGEVDEEEVEGETEGVEEEEREEASTCPSTRARTSVSLLANL